MKFIYKADIAWQDGSVQECAKLQNCDFLDAKW